MNLDVISQINFGDAKALRDFFLAHRFVHDQTASALTAKFKLPVSSFGVTDELAERAWIDSMDPNRRGAPTSASLQAWLNIHNTIHVNTYSLLGQSVNDAPDLSQVDFSRQDQFYDWLYTHQTMHDFEQVSLGLT